MNKIKSPYTAAITGGGSPTNLSPILGFMNPSVMMNFIRLLCPTISFQRDDVFKTPYIPIDKKH